MTNPLKGEVSFKSGDQNYVLVYSMDALIALEEIFDCTVKELGGRLNDDLRMKDLRTLFHAGLRERQPDLTETDASRIVSEIGLPSASLIFRRAFVGAFGDVGGKSEAGTGERPRRARGGTGEPVSTSGSNTGSEPRPSSGA